MPNKFVGHGPYHYAEGGHVRKERKFKFDEGGEIDPMSSVTPAPDMPVAAPEPAPEAPPAAPPRVPSFKEAFAAARAAGVPTFEWQGRKFTTELAPTRPAAPAAARPAPQAARPAPRANPGASTPTAAPAAAAAPYSNEGRNSTPPARATGMGVNPRMQAAAVEAAAKLQRGRAGGYAAGGSIDGCASRGKTKGRMV